MIGKLFASTNARSTVLYGVGGTTKEQPVRILGSSGLLLPQRDVEILNESWEGRGDEHVEVVRQAAAKLSDAVALQFDRQARFNGRVRKNTGHFIISHPPWDAARIESLAKEWGCGVYDAHMRIAERFLERMGLSETQYIAVFHLDRHCPHIHIAFNRVGFDGLTVNSSFSMLRCMEVSKELSSSYGLTVPEKGVSISQGLVSEIRDIVLEEQEKSEETSESINRNSNVMKF